MVTGASGRLGQRAPLRVVMGGGPESGSVITRPGRPAANRAQATASRPSSVTMKEVSLIGSNP